MQPDPNPPASEPCDHDFSSFPSAVFDGPSRNPDNCHLFVAVYEEIECSRTDCYATENIVRDFAVEDVFDNPDAVSDERIEQINRSGEVGPQAQQVDVDVIEVTHPETGERVEVEARYESRSISY